MDREEGYFKTFDGLKLFFRFYRHAQPGRWMIILHGHGEHSGRYEKFYERLQDEQVSIASFDARGTGRSEGREVYVRSFEDFLQDITCFFHFFKTKQAFSGKPVLFGHSMGGLAAMHWVQKYPNEISTLILSSPCLGVRLPAHLKILNGLLNRIVPFYAYSNPVYPPYLSHDQKEVERYRIDPYVKRKITVRLLSEMIDYAAKIQRIDNFYFPFPVYVLMAGLERIVDPDQTRKIFEKIHAPRKLLRCFDSFYHEIFNELGQDGVFQALKECLKDSAGFQTASR